MKKVIQTETLFWGKKARSIRKKKLGCEFIRINTSNAENDYDLEYEVNKKIKEVKDKNKKLKDKNKELEEKLEKLEKELK